MALFPILFVVVVLAIIAFARWQRIKNTPTEEAVVCLMAMATVAEERLEALENLPVPSGPTAKAKHQIAINKASMRARQARWEAHDAGIKAGVIEDLSW